MIEFLSLLFQYTFMQASLEGFMSCLEIWETFLDYILSQQEDSQPSVLHLRYADGLAALTQELVRKALFNTNARLLDTLDTEDSADGANDSEIETYLSGCLNLIGKVAQLYPAKILGILSSVVDRAQALLNVHTLPPASPEFNYTVRDTEVVLRIFSQTACGFVHPSIDFRFILTSGRDRLLWMLPAAVNSCSYLYPSRSISCNTISELATLLLRKCMSTRPVYFPVSLTIVVVRLRCSEHFEHLHHGFNQSSV